MNAISDIINAQHRYFNLGKTKKIPFRIAQLIKLKKVLKENEVEILEALKSDFKKPVFESYGTELGILYDEIDHAVKKLHSWAKPDKVSGSLVTFPSTSYIHYQPFGVVLVLGAWNYPVQLALNPAIGAIAAGNCVIVKPSELAPNSSSVIEFVINQNFDPELLHVVEGGADISQELLSQPLDYIFYTGSSRVGKIVMKAAADQLTPVTLELGGKSPAIVDETADLDTAARRIAWGKFINAGQTCVAPDYVYVHSSIKEDLIPRLSDYITKFYGEDPLESPDYPRIIDDRHFRRLLSLLDSVRIVTGGETDEESRYIAPTIVDDVSWNDPIMQEEIFGPILPVLPFDNIKQVIDEVNKRAEPLSLYLFSSNSTHQNEIVEKIKFGGGCINDTVFHLGNKNLPFGGIGGSGFGSYHGESSFRLFSHQKSILKKPTWIDIPLRYPPYKGKLKWLKMIFG